MVLPKDIEHRVAFDTTIDLRLLEQLARAANSLVADFVYQDSTGYVGFNLDVNTDQEDTVQTNPRFASHFNCYRVPERVEKFIPNVRNPIRVGSHIHMLIHPVVP